MSLSKYDKRRAKQFRIDRISPNEDDMEQEEEHEEEDDDINDDEKYMWQFYINDDGSVSRKRRNRIPRVDKDQLQYPVYESNDFKSLGKIFIRMIVME